MTAREMIQKLVNTCQNLDDDIPVYILTRDEFGGVIKKFRYIHNNIINGKLYIEDVKTEEYV